MALKGYLGDYLTFFSCTIILVQTQQPQIFIYHNNNQQLVCVYKADQKTDIIMKFLPWKHSIDDQLVREIEGYYVNTTVYSLNNMTNSQPNGGNYTCTVNNGITLQKAVYNFIPRQAPISYEPTRHKGELQVGDDCTFTVTYLEDSSLNVSWYRYQGFQKLETTNRVTIREEPTEISHLYNNNIKLSGIKTILTITSVIITDRGFYTSRSCNQHGCSSISIQLAIADAVAGGITITEAVIVGVLAVALLIVGIFVFIKCKQYRASKQRENSEQNVYDKTVSTVPTPSPVYDTLGATENEHGSSVYDRAIHVPSPESEYTRIGATENEHGSSVYDRAIHVPSPESEYTRIGLQNQYENPPNQPPSVNYHTASGISRTEPLKEEADISND